MKNILIIIAHPDDEVLGMGGTIKKKIDLGFKISILVLSKPGNARPNEDPNIRLNNFKDVVEKLGIKNVYYEDFPDTSFDSIRLLDIIKKIEIVLDIIKPDIVYTHFYNDLNIDHGIVSRAVITSLRPISRFNFVKNIFLFEIPSTTELSLGLDKFISNYYEDISGYIEFKKELLSIYNSELREFPHPISFEGIETYAKYRGLESGLKFAEAFILYRSLN